MITGLARLTLYNLYRIKYDQKENLNVNRNIIDNSIENKNIISLF